MNHAVLGLVFIHRARLHRRGQSLSTIPDRRLIPLPILDTLNLLVHLGIIQPHHGSSWCACRLVASRPAALQMVWLFQSRPCLHPALTCSRRLPAVPIPSRFTQKGEPPISSYSPDDS